MATKKEVAPKKTDNEYHIFADINVNATLTITANSFTEAAEKAKELKITDFVTSVEDFNDWTEPKILSICKY